MFYDSYTYHRLRELREEELARKAGRRPGHLEAQLGLDSAKAQRSMISALTARLARKGGRASAERCSPARPSW